MSLPLLVFADVQHDEHVAPPMHPENQRRLDAVIAGVDAAGLVDATQWRVPSAASFDDLVRVHDPDYVRSLEAFCASGGGRLDEDTYATAGSWPTALRSAGAVLDAIEALRNGEGDVAFAAGRPPGHHAETNRAMGFCLLNNVAVGAASLVAGGERVAIIDWDVHHGNGTQDIFYNDPNVLYVSTHESPLYPGTGRLLETGGEQAPFTNLNIPLPPGSAGDTYRAAFDDVIIPAVEAFAPDWLLVSAGFDAHRNDPLASMSLSATDYADFALRLQPLVPKQRLMVVLEGGYDPEALTTSTGATLSALVGENYRPDAASVGDVGRVHVTKAKQVWGFDGA